jgi:hypothetical protein
LVVGTATGRVSAYPIAHIIEPPPNKHADPEKFAAIQELHAFAARNHFVAVTLGKASDEGIRSIFFLDDEYASWTHCMCQLVHNTTRVY